MRMAAGMETARRFMRFGVLGLGFALLLAAFALVPPASVVRGHRHRDELQQQRVG